MGASRDEIDLFIDYNGLIARSVYNIKTQIYTLLQSIIALNVKPDLLLGIRARDDMIKSGDLVLDTKNSTFSKAHQVYFSLQHHSVISASSDGFIV